MIQTGFHVVFDCGKPLSEKVSEEHTIQNHKHQYLLYSAELTRATTAVQPAEGPR